MIVVSNTSPIMNLAVVGQLQLLEQLYHKVRIPEAVLQELVALDLSQIQGKSIQTISWIETHPLTNRPLADLLLLELHTGEAEAIVLALEMGANLLLLDERRGRQVASRMGIKCLGLLSMLIEAKHQGLISVVKPILDDLIAQAGFWVSSQLYTRILQAAAE